MRCYAAKRSYGEYSSNHAADPRGPGSGDYRVLRGGGWNGNARDCRVAYRYGFYPDLSDFYWGFRLARTDR